MKGATMEAIQVTETQLANALAEWVRSCRENPNLTETERLKKEPPEIYGEICAPYLFKLLKGQPE